MNTQEIKQLYHYNSWANNKYFDAVSQVPADQYLQDMKSSHGGLHGTFLHIIAAQKMWLSRWNGTPDKALVKQDEIQTLADLKSLWQKVEADTSSMLETITDEKLLQSMTMTTTKGDTYVHTYAQMMQHLVNHSSYHRGQLAALLRQLNIKPPSTDFIAFLRH